MVSVLLENVNDCKPTLMIANHADLVVNQNSKAGVLVTRLQAMDEDKPPFNVLEYGITHYHITKYFDIDSKSGEIFTSENWQNNETYGNISFGIWVKDGHHVINKNVTITVIADKQIYWALKSNSTNLESIFISENQLQLDQDIFYRAYNSPNDQVGTLVNYSLTSSQFGLSSLDISRYLRIDRISGKLKLIDLFDFEYLKSQNQFQNLNSSIDSNTNKLVVKFYVLAEVQLKYDDIKLNTSMLVNLFITDRNEFFPVFTQYFYYVNISESTLPGEVIFKVTAIDLDGSSPNNYVNYRLTSLQDEFQLISTTGYILTKKTFKAGSFFTLNLQAYDLGQPSLSNLNASMLIIAVGDEFGNEGGENLLTFGYDKLYLEVEDNIKRGGLVEHVKLRGNHNIVMNLTFWMHMVSYVAEINENSSAILEYFIMDVSGRIFLNEDLEHSFLKNITFNVYAKDSITNQTDSTLLCIVIKRVDKENITFNQPAYEVSISEFTKSYCDILRVVASYTNGDLIISGYYITDESGHFDINKTTGTIFTTDRELSKSFCDTFHFKAGVESQDVQEVNITVKVLHNSALQWTSPIDKNITISETTALHESITLFDVDVVNSNLTCIQVYYSFVDTILIGNSSMKNNYFSLDKITGELTVVKSLNFSLVSRYDLLVNATCFLADRNLFIEAIFGIQIEPEVTVNPLILLTPPSRINIDKRISVGSSIYTFRYDKDTDGYTDNLALPVVTIESIHNGIQGIFAANGSDLIVIGKLMEVEEGCYDVVVSVDVPRIPAEAPRTHGTPATWEMLTLNLSLCINRTIGKTPEFLVPSENDEGFNILENVAKGFELLRCEVSSKVGDIVEFYLFSNYSLLPFEINKFTGLITTNGTIDCERNNMYQFEVHSMVTLTNMTSIRKLTINVIDLDDNDPFFPITAKITLKVSESTSIGKHIFQVPNAIDLDTSPQYKNICYSLSDNNYIKLEDQSLVVANILDKEILNDLTLKVFCSNCYNNSTNSSTLDVIVEVLDVDDNYPVFTKRQLHVGILHTMSSLPRSPLSNKSHSIADLRRYSHDNDSELVAKYIIVNKYQDDDVDEYFRITEKGKINIINSHFKLNSKYIFMVAINDPRSENIQQILVKTHFYEVNNQLNAWFDECHLPTLLSKESQFADILSEKLSVIIIIDYIGDYSSQSSEPSKCFMKLHGINDNLEVLKAEYLISLIDDGGAELMSILYNKFKLVKLKKTEIKSSPLKNKSKLQIILIVISFCLAMILLISLMACIFCKLSHKRNMQRATHLTLGTPPHTLSFDNSGLPPTYVSNNSFHTLWPDTASNIETTENDSNREVLSCYADDMETNELPDVRRAYTQQSIEPNH